MESPLASRAPVQTSALVRGDRGLAPWITLGFAASVALVVSGASVGSVPRSFHGYSWFGLPRSGSPLLTVVFYLALILMVVAWLGVGAGARRGALTTGRASAVLAAWGLPLFLGPPLFSRDLYSYVAQGLIAHHGLDPYTVGPVALGSGPVLLSVAQVWRATAAPYGPLFVIITKAVAAVFGTSLISEILALRLLELMGVALIITSLCRLARIFGADPGIALWLGVLSPLALYSFISSGHNDALMLGLLLTGVTLAMERHPVAGVVLCALGAMIKLPAAAGIVFIIAGQFTGPRGERRWAAMAKLIVAPVVTVVVVTLATGLGWRWLGPSALRIPAQLRILATPAVSIGASVYHVLHLVGLPVTQHACVTVLQTLCGAAGAAVVIWLVIKARTLDVTRTLGIALLVIVLVGPTLWPWYFTWGLILLAATPAQRAKPLAVVAGLAMFLVGPSGSPMLGGIDYLAVTLACAAGLRWLLKDQRWMDVVGVGRRVVTS